MSEPNAVVDHAGFTVHDRGQKHRVDWSEISEIWAYKRDCGIVDSIRLSFRLRDGMTFEIAEELEDYQQVRVAIERRFPVNPDWWIVVAFPAFATNLIRIWPYDAADPLCEVNPAENPAFVTYTPWWFIYIRLHELLVSICGWTTLGFAIGYFVPHLDLSYLDVPLRRAAVGGFSGLGFAIIRGISGQLANAPQGTRWRRFNSIPLWRWIALLICIGMISLILMPARAKISWAPWEWDEVIFEGISRLCFVAALTVPTGKMIISALQQILVARRDSRTPSESPSL